MKFVKTINCKLGNSEIYDFTKNSRRCPVSVAPPDELLLFQNNFKFQIYECKITNTIISLTLPNTNKYYFNLPAKDKS